MRDLVRAAKLDPDFRDFAQRIIVDVAAKDWAGEIAALFDFVRNRITYRLDVNGVEVIQSPTVTLSLGYGDCDDKATLLAAALEVCGHPAWFCAMGFEAPGLYSHVIVLTSGAGEQPIVALDATEWRPLGWYPPAATCLLIAEIGEGG